MKPKKKARHQTNGVELLASNFAVLSVSLSLTLFQVSSTTACLSLATHHARFHTSWWMSFLSRDGNLRDGRNPTAMILIHFIGLPRALYRRLLHMMGKKRPCAECVVSLRCKLYARDNEPHCRILTRNETKNRRTALRALPAVRRQIQPSLCSHGYMYT